MATVAQAEVGLSQQHFAGRSAWTHGISLDLSAPSREPWASRVSATVAPPCVRLQVAEEMATVKEKLPLSSGFQRLPSTLVPCQASFQGPFSTSRSYQIAFSIRLSTPLSEPRWLSTRFPCLLGKASLAPALGSLAPAVRGFGAEVWGCGRRGTGDRTSRERLYSGEASSHELRTSLANCFGVSLEMGAVSLACLGDSCGLGT